LRRVGIDRYGVSWGFGSSTEPVLTAVHVTELLAIPKTRVSSMSRRGDIPTVRTDPREALSLGGHRHLDRPAHDLTRPRGTQS
jgi:hypothetical protein